MLDLSKLPPIESLDDTAAMDIAGQLVDLAGDTATSEILDRAFEWCQQLDGRNLSALDRLNLDYYTSNAWAHRVEWRHQDRSAVWSWDQEEQERQIYLLRRALNSSAIEEVPLSRASEIRTNLANLLSNVGRFVEAQSLWSETLERQPEFWMARGNRGWGLVSYAHALYDGGHQAVFSLFAFNDLSETVATIAKHPELGDINHKSRFEAHASWITERVDLMRVKASYRPAQHTLSSVELEARYQRWCLQERLYVNPLNDVEQSAIAAQDALLLPSFVTSYDEPPVYLGFFSQLKQEYASLRWTYFEGLTSTEVHHSDNGVLLYNTLDYPAYGLACEQIKLAFRMAYSLLDKIAYFLNHYLSLGIPEKQVSFRSVWLEKPKGAIRRQFAESENWSFRGLYWLGKDLFEADFQDVAAPNAREFAELRNHLEHKYVKVVSIAPPRRSADDTEWHDPLFDTLAHTLTLKDLQRRSLRLIKMAREALIYLSLGMHQEEQRRKSKVENDDGPNFGPMPMEVPLFEDERKRPW
ncbi:LA2681 family HEPN domain-containing protein [Paraburkholderia caribensis]|uniref:LA2681 family HEPN domain-containing protein n=1 Tax=Paraburkholderia caribensis TaxID=75105 RepID=UPI0031D5BF9E